MAGIVCALLIVFSCCYLLPPAGSVVFGFSSFSENDNMINLQGDASFELDRGLIDLSSSKREGMNYSVGRASYAYPVPLWDKATGEVASFTTRFSFTISKTDMATKGSGMTFFLACYPSILPYKSFGYALGLMTQSADAVVSGDSRFAAVEFDTANSSHVPEPDTNHIGIDVNSVKSVTTVALPRFNLSGDMTAAINYDNVSGILAATLLLDDGRGRNYSLSSKVDLKNALPEQVAVGFSASTGGYSVELHKLRSWYFNSSLESPSIGGSRRGGVIAGATAGAALFLVILFAMAALLVRRRRSKKKRETEEGGIGSEDGDGEHIMEIEMGTGPRRLPYHQIADATRNFAAEEKLGQGGFGAVYRGYLRELGLAVAIKRFSKDSSMQGRREYKSEIMVISRLRHRNLVQLVGWCHGRDELLLVYELMPNRSLDIHLYSKDTPLTWPMRIKIILGVGSALLYLHEEWEQCVVHRDIKPSNVMLDESFGAKLGDFGLARLIDHAVGMQTMTAMSGTPGYVDPHSLITGKASAASDIYSFGVLLLEVASGRRPVSQLSDSKMNGGVFRLVEWVWYLYGRGAVLDAADERLGGDYDGAEMERVMAVGLWCAHPDLSARPPIRAAMAVLQCKETRLLPVLPVRMPVPTYALPPDGLYSYGALPTGMYSSYSYGGTHSTTTTTSGSAPHTSTSSGSKDSSSLLNCRYSVLRG